MEQRDKINTSIVYVHRNGFDKAFKALAIAFFLFASVYLALFMWVRFVPAISENHRNSQSSVSQQGYTQLGSIYHKSLVIENGTGSANDDQNFLSNEGILAMISALGIFAAALAYVFKEIVRRDMCEELNKETQKILKTALKEIRKENYALDRAIRDEQRIATKLETRIMASFTLTKLYKLGLGIKNKSVSEHDDMSEIASVYEDEKFLNKAIDIDTSAIELTKQIKGVDFKDLVLKVENNRANNIALKYEEYVLGANDDMDKCYYQDRIIALAIRDKLLAFVEKEGGDNYHDIAKKHLAAFSDTCARIERVFLSKK